MNLQQIPSKGSEAKAMRSCFIGDPNELVVTSDISGAELRLIAEASQDPLWIGSFCNGEDLHSVLCSRLFKIDLKEVKNPFPLKPDITYRDVIKTINFGLAYGMSEFKLSNTIKTSVEEARGIIEEYFSVVPKVEKYLKNSGEYGRKYGVSYTIGPIKRPRYFDIKYANSLDDRERKKLL